MRCGLNAARKPRSPSLASYAPSSMQREPSKFAANCIEWTSGHMTASVARKSSRLRLGEKSASTPRLGTGATGARDERGSHTLSPAPPDGYLGVMVRAVDVGEVVDGG